jgi:amino acid transporter
MGHMSDGPSGRDEDGAARLASLGYKQELKRQVSVLGNIALTLSDISPTATLLVVGPVLITAAGTGSFWALIIGGIVSLCIAWCIGELGSMYPVAGGLYSMTRIVLGPALGFLALIAVVVVTLFLPAAIAIGIGTYLTTLTTALPTNIAAAIIMAVVTGLSLLQIRFNAILTGVFLALELTVVVALTLAGVLHVHHSGSILIHPVQAGAHGGLAPVPLSVIISAVALAVFAVSGYESAVNFAEETEGRAKGIGEAVVNSFVIGIVFIAVPFVAILFGAGDLSTFLSSSTPLTDVARAAFGNAFVDFLTAGAILAILNAALAITLQYARVLYASGRDRAWPDPINKWISLLLPSRGSPWVATLLVGAVGVILCIQSTLVSVITFTSVVYVVSYGLVVVAALVSRIRNRAEPRPYRLPFWPIPPLIALAGIIYAITQQTHHDLIITGAIFAGGLVYYLVFLRPRSATHWNVMKSSASPDSVVRVRD